MKQFIATLLLTALAATPATAATLCRGVYIAGFADAAERGKAVVGAATDDVTKMRIYAERVPGGWYYQTNVVVAGAPFPAKIVSENRLSLKVVVANMLRRPLTTPMTRAVVVADVSLFDGEASVQLASAE